MSVEPGRQASEQLHRIVGDCDSMRVDITETYPCIHYRDQDGFHSANSDLGIAVRLAADSCAEADANELRELHSRVEQARRDVELLEPDSGGHIMERRVADFNSAIDELRVYARYLLERSGRAGIDNESHDCLSNSPFVPNEFQKSILQALTGRARKKKQLAEEVCGGEGTRLYRNGGINELRAAGLVDHKHGLGYFRPDALPPSP